jgi:hypothetical protein
MLEPEKESTEAKAVAFLFMLAAIPIDGWVFSRLWLWFVVPTGPKPIGTVHAMGLMMLLRFATTNRYTAGKLDDWMGRVLQSVFYALFALAFGWFFNWIGIAP